MDTQRQFNFGVAPLRPLPQTAYDKMKNFLMNHRNLLPLHFFLHNTYCRLVFAYTPIPYEIFAKNHNARKTRKVVTVTVLYTRPDFPEGVEFKRSYTLKVKENPTDPEALIRKAFKIANPSWHIVKTWL